MWWLQNYIKRAKLLAFFLLFKTVYVKIFTLRKWAMFNLKNIFSENSENKNSNDSSNFLGDGKAILDAVDDGVLAVDSKGNIVAINPAATQITGWSGSDAVGLIFNSVLKISNNDGAEMLDVSNPVNRVLQTGMNFTTRDLFVKTPSGKVVPIFLAVNSIGGQNSGAVVVFRDISKELKENREQAEFISTASHEMRTPVASIEGYLGLALNPATATIDARAKSYLEKAHENTRHLGQLFQDLLDITKAEDGRLKNEPVVLDAVEFARNIWEGLKQKASEKGLNYIFEPDDHKTGEKTLTPVFFIHADRDHLHEVLNNLFENAIKYTPSGKVSVNVTGKNDNVEISVTDSGIGIPAEDIPHLFQKFYRVDNSETREINGTGLGLFLSRKLTESIGGSLNVESEYKKGSTFTVKLPRITRENAEALKAKEEEKKTEEHQKIEAKRNQREIEEADRDIAAILESTENENPSDEVFEKAHEIQLEVAPVPAAIPQQISNPQPVQPAQPVQIPQAISNIQPVQQTQQPRAIQPNSPAQNTQNYAGNDFSNMQTFKIEQNQEQIFEAQRAQDPHAFLNAQPAQSTQIQPNPERQTFKNPQTQIQQNRSVMNSIQPNSSTQNTQPMHSSASLNPAMMRTNVSQNIQNLQVGQVRNPQQVVQQNISPAAVQVQNLTQNPQVVQNNYSTQSPQAKQMSQTIRISPPAPIPTPQMGQLPPNPPSLNDIERMKIEYAQRMMAQKK